MLLNAPPKCSLMLPLDAPWWSPWMLLDAPPECSLMLPLDAPWCSPLILLDPSRCLLSILPLAPWLLQAQLTLHPSSTAQLALQMALLMPYSFAPWLQARVATLFICTHCQPFHLPTYSFANLFICTVAAGAHCHPASWRRHSPRRSRCKYTEARPSAGRAEKRQSASCGSREEGRAGGTGVFVCLCGWWNRCVCGRAELVEQVCLWGQSWWNRCVCGGMYRFGFWWGCALLWYWWCVLVVCAL